MKIETLRPVIVSCLLVCGMTACGGGGSDASGAPGSLSVTPAEVGFGFGGSATDCSPFVDTTGANFPGVTTVLINGGAGSYIVTSTTPDLVVGPVTRVNGVSQFTFTKVTSTCSTTGMIIQVEDVRKNLATVKVTAKTASSP